MLYKIINMSDKYTIIAPDHAVATVACVLLGSGQYSFDPVGDDKSLMVPFMMFGGADNFCLEKFGATLDDLINVTLMTKSEALAACLDSCLIGNRDDFDACAKAIDDPEKIAVFKAERHDRLRSSMNDIGKRAAILATKVRQKNLAGAQQAPQQVFSA